MDEVKGHIVVQREEESLCSMHVLEAIELILSELFFGILCPLARLVLLVTIPALVTSPAHQPHRACYVLAGHPLQSKVTRIHSDCQNAGTSRLEGAEKNCKWEEMGIRYISFQFGHPGISS